MGNESPLKKEQQQKLAKLIKQDFVDTVVLYDVEEIQFPLSTKGMKIVDQTGRRVKLAGTNWSGGHAQRQCPAGLDCVHISSICKSIKESFGMNSVRLTFSLQMFYDNIKIPNKHIKANPEMKGKTAMQIFDMTIQQLTKTGIMVYLNNHTSKAQWCCSVTDGQGLWYTKQYSQEKYFECLVAFAARYKHNPLVIGMDLRNQIRPSFLNLPSWGNKGKNDWHLASTTIGNKIHEIAPHWLIIIGGLNFQLDLTPMKKCLVQLKIPNKVIYSGHLYSFSWPIWQKGYWKYAKYKDFEKKIIEDQLFIRHMGAPFILGEFGTNKKNKYWTFLMRLLKQTDIDWSYWCLDGYKCVQQNNQTFGMLTKNFKNIRYNWMLKDLKGNGRPRNHKKAEKNEEKKDEQKQEIVNQKEQEVNESQDERKDQKFENQKDAEQEQNNEEKIKEEFMRQQYF